MRRPNLFRFATKELSQDAVICWLIEWAGTRTNGNPEDESLRRLGRAFVDALFAKWSDWPVELGAEVCTKIYQQDHNIDVLARVNGKVLLIEDKTGSSVHGGQLERYLNVVLNGETSVGAASGDDVYPIYFKTGNFALSELNMIEDRGYYRVFGRRDFLEVLYGYDGQDQILLDYRTHLQELEDRTNSYAEWTRDSPRDDPDHQLAWEGLYRRIQEDLAQREMRWSDYDHRVFGPLHGVTWRPKGVGDEAWLWLVRTGKDGRSGDAELSFKLVVPDEQQQELLQQTWHNALMSAGGEAVAKPRRMRRDKTMTVALWAEDVLVFSEADGRLDIAGTLGRLRSAERVLEAAAVEMGYEARVGGGKPSSPAKPKKPGQ